MTDELKKKRGKSSWSNNRPYASGVGCDGRNVGGLRRKSASGLSEPRTIQRNGPTMNTSPPMRMTYAQVVEPLPCPTERGRVAFGPGAAGGGAWRTVAAVIDRASCVRPQELELEERHDRDDHEQDVREGRGIPLVEEREALLVHVHRHRQGLVER